MAVRVAVVSIFLGITQKQKYSDGRETSPLMENLKFQIPNEPIFLSEWTSDRVFSQAEAKQSIAKVD